MLRTYVYERTYALLKYDARLKYPLCYDPQDKIPMTTKNVKKETRIVRNDSSCRTIDTHHSRQLHPPPPTFEHFSTCFIYLVLFFLTLLRFNGKINVESRVIFES